MRTDGQIGTTKLVVAFRDSANVPERKRELCPHLEGVYREDRYSSTYSETLGARLR